MGKLIQICYKNLSFIIFSDATLQIFIEVRRSVLIAAHKGIGGPGSSVGIANGYGLDGPGIESRWGEIFRTCPDRP
jgi:hypothetical protein